LDATEPTESAPTDSHAHAHPIGARPIRDQTRQISLLETARDRALDASIFDEFTPFFWEAEFSNSLLDAYFTVMSERTLANYAADAQAGIAFLRGHRWDELPLGQSLSGRLEQFEGRTRVLADFYTVAGLTDTDDLIRRMKSGLARDVSVGFSGGREICRLCGNNYWSRHCPHIRGLIYEVEENGVVRQVLATVEIDDAHASEVSAVYDGATPKAEISKARRIAADGALNQEQVATLEARYRVKLPASAKRHAGANAQNGDMSMDYEKVVNDVRGPRHGAGFAHAHPKRCCATRRHHWCRGSP
jgi:hypothetical protein